MSSAAPSTSRVRSVNKTLAAGRGTPASSLAASQRLRPGRLRSAGALFRGGDGEHAANVRSALIAHNGKSETTYTQQVKGATAQQERKRNTTPTAAAYNPNAPRVGPGVYTLADIRDRCRVDDITGCWHWAMALRSGGHQATSRTPSVSLPAGVIGGASRTLSVGRVVWLMQGKPLTAKQVVWRTCGHDDCCAPAHLQAGTKAEEGAFWRATGRRRGDPLRAAVNARNCGGQAVPAEKVQLVAELIEAGRRHVDIASATGVHKATISKIARGKHFHQRPRGARGASVFNLGAAGGA